MMRSFRRSTSVALSSTSLAAMFMLMSSGAFAAKSPQDFLKDAIMGDNSEIMLGHLAQQKGGSQR